MLCSGPNLDDDEDEDVENKPDMNGSSGDAKPKTSQQKSGEALLRHILNSEYVDGSSFSFRYFIRRFATSLTNSRIELCDILKEHFLYSGIKLVSFCRGSGSLVTTGHFPGFFTIGR